MHPKLGQLLDRGKKSKNKKMEKGKNNIKQETKTKVKV